MTCQRACLRVSDLPDVLEPSLALDELLVVAEAHQPPPKSSYHPATTSHGDKMALVHMHLRHVEDCTAATAREKHYDALREKHYDARRGEACCRFLRTKAQQEYDKHRWVCKDNEGKKATPLAGHL